MYIITFVLYLKEKLISIFLTLCVIILSFFLLFCFLDYNIFTTQYESLQENPKLLQDIDIEELNETISQYQLRKDLLNKFSILPNEVYTLQLFEEASN